MKQQIVLGLTLAVIGFVVGLLYPAIGVAQTPDWSDCEKMFGRKGTTQGNVLKITFPRTDLNVKVGDVQIEPGLALTSWLAFSAMGDRAMVMGDLVLLENEIASVEKKMIEHNLEISAIHNHIIGEQPKVMYMHVGGEGDLVKLAEGLKSVLDQTATPRALQPASSKPVDVNWAIVESTLARTGKHNGDLLQLSVPRAEKVTEHGMDITPFMGMATAINIQMIGEKRAATTGDFVLLAEEVNPVVQALLQHGITVTAVHSHMLFESPRLFFLHFWGVDDPIGLAKGLKAALDKTNSSH